jgi:hypothetical protein
MSKQKTFVARWNGKVAGTRSSATMAYTHAVVVKGDEPTVWSYHLTEEAARKAASDVSPSVVVAVEVHDGGKAKVERALRQQEVVAVTPGGTQTVAQQAEATLADVEATSALSSPEAMADYAKRVQAQTAEKGSSKKAAKAAAKPSTKKAPAKAAEAPQKAATAGSRSVPTEAANKARQAYLDEAGMDRYRQQYNSGWDAATAGQGTKKAASGTASVAWMDGWTDRMAHPGKEGIASKWSALRSTDAPVAKVDAPVGAQEVEARAEAAKAKAGKKA